ncbi:Sec62/63 complex, subunit Sec66 [Moelleriella libera RCEF 2490]|uniref:Sec62/63 complex, subunit Sec66 n=1 Tax=Moelleriella libera RCEF 2490 TaxID=1081109 RepID=A0A167WYI3_9HYPO|nr:Sec62/63 complex, subunit Sec66 [Moelleriella libera RCEF 2490]
MFDIDWKGLALPLAYLMVLGGALMTFSTIYRKRKAAESANLTPWFGPNLQRNVYLTLLHLDPEDGKEKSPRIPDSVLKAALLRRAVEDIDRLIQIKSAKQACSSLLLRGSVGDDLWQRFQRAEKEMEEELRDVVTEANALAPNWGPTIFQSAHEIAANTRLRERLQEIESQKEAEKQWWEKKRSQISSDFMKELDEPTKEGASEEDAVLVGVPSKGKKSKR